jgi:carbon storage regulator
MLNCEVADDVIVPNWATTPILTEEPMLILSRHVGQQVCIGDGIVVTVLAARKGQLKLGIEAPAEVAVDRAEVHARKAARHALSAHARLPAHPR